MAEHRLKTWPPYFRAQQEGRKPFEVRRNDRNYRVGDKLVLCEYRPCPDPSAGGVFTGRELRRRVMYILRGGQHGIEPGYVVMGTAPDA